MRPRHVFFAVLIVATLSGAFPAFSQPKGVTQIEPMSVVFEPKHQAVLSAGVSSTIKKINVEMGQAFAKGDTLVELDKERYKSSLSKAQGVAAAAGKGHEVTTRLHHDKSASDLDLAEAQRDATAANANVGLAKHDLAFCDLKAPFDGRVKETLAHEHEWVEQGKPIIGVIDDKILIAQILMPANDFTAVKIGDPVEIAVRETGQTVPGKISHISQSLDPASGTFKVFAEVNNASGAVKSGMTGQVRMP